MPEPISIIAAIAGIGAAGIGAYSAISSASAQSDAADFNSKVAANNAQQAKQEADAEAARVRDKNRRILASQKAAYAASGVQISGTVTDVLLDSATQGELDAMSVEYAGKVRQNALISQSELLKKESSNASKAGIFGAAGYGLSGVASTANSYSDYRYKKDMKALKGIK